MDSDSIMRRFESCYPRHFNRNAQSGVNQAPRSGVCFIFCFFHFKFSF